MAECLIALIVLRSLVWSFLPCAASLLPSLAEACAYISSVMLLMLSLLIESDCIALCTLIFLVAMGEVVKIVDFGCFFGAFASVIFGGFA